MDIRDLPSAWRAELMPASYRGARFHVDAETRESGRRIVTHEFPKKDLPYSEDMGRRAREFSVRGYIIVFPFDAADELQRRDYRPARDRLIRALESEGIGRLVFPTLPPMEVVVTRYRVTEEDRTGGYCSFDMSFVEAGKAPALDRQSSQAALQGAANGLGEEAANAYELGSQPQGDGTPQPGAPRGNVEILTDEIKIE